MCEVAHEDAVHEVELGLSLGPFGGVERDDEVLGLRLLVVVIVLALALVASRTPVEVAFDY